MKKPLSLGKYSVFLGLLQVLKKTHQQEWDERLNFLKSSPHFRSWPNRVLKSVAAASKVIEYGQDEVRTACQ